MILMMDQDIILSISLTPLTVASCWILLRIERYVIDNEYIVTVNILWSNNRGRMNKYMLGITQKLMSLLLVRKLYAIIAPTCTDYLTIELCCFRDSIYIAVEFPIGIEFIVLL